MEKLCVSSAWLQKNSSTMWILDDACDRENLMFPVTSESILFNVYEFVSINIHVLIIDNVSVHMYSDLEQLLKGTHF